MSVTNIDHRFVMKLKKLVNNGAKPPLGIGLATFIHFSLLL